MKTIGFIDYYLDEWHANNFPAWIRESSRRAEMDLAFAWAEQDKEGGLSTDEWCEKFGARRTSSLEELVNDADYLVVLSPDHPERHEELARLPLASGKPTYIDKTFAPDLATAKRIFAMAEKHGTPLFSSSALRYAVEVEEVRQKAETSPIQFLTTGGGGKFEIYLVHQLEMIVGLLGTGDAQVLVSKAGEAASMHLRYADGRQAHLQMMPQMPFRLSATLESGEAVHYPSLDGAFFPRFVEAMLQFFADGKPSVSASQTLQIMGLIDAGRQGLQRPGEWIDVAQ